MLHKYQIYTNISIFYNIKCLRNIYKCFYHELGQSNSNFFTTYHDSLPALLPLQIYLASSTSFLFAYLVYEPFSSCIKKSYKKAIKKWVYVYLFIFVVGAGLA
jgi:hypothetical protein